MQDAKEYQTMDLKDLLCRQHLGPWGMDALNSILATRFKKEQTLRSAATALYEAGHWHLTNGSPLLGPDQWKLWEDLRDALGRKP